VDRYREPLRWGGLVVRLAVGIIWIWASLSKIGDPRTFVRAVRAYKATPEWLSQAIGYGLPMLELILGVLLVIGLIVRYAAAVSAALYVVFLIGIIQAAARGIKLECGCFGGGGSTAHTQYTLEILRDLGLLVLAAYLIVVGVTRLSVDEFIIKTEMVPGLTPKQAKSDKNVRRYKAAVAAAETELRHKQRYIAAGTALVVILVSFVAIGVQSNRAKISPTADSTNATTKLGVTVGNAKAPVTVDLYEDLQCPICNDLEQSGLTKDIEQKITATNIKVNFHIMSFLDASSNGNKYSSRAANAAYCASDVSPDAFLKFHAIAYGQTNGKNNQPAENTNGVPDATLLDWGKQAGITAPDFTTCVTQDQHSALVAGVTDQASKNGVNGTPTVFVQGKEVKGTGNASVTLAEVDAAINAALKAAKSTAAPSSSPPASKGSSASPSASATTSKG